MNVQADNLGSQPKGVLNVVHTCHTPRQCTTMGTSVAAAKSFCKICLGVREKYKPRRRGERRAKPALQDARAAGARRARRAAPRVSRPERLNTPFAASASPGSAGKTRAGLQRERAPERRSARIWHSGRWNMRCRSGSRRRRLGPVGRGRAGRVRSPPCGRPRQAGAKASGPSPARCTRV